MSEILVLIVFQLVQFHGPGGGSIDINPEQVTSLRAGQPHRDGEVFTEAAECMIGLSDGKFATVIEDCATVRKRLEETSRAKNQR
jgi:hypothetical protein